MFVFEAKNVEIKIKGLSLFKPLSFTVQPGEVVAIMGPSGSGKSSLLSYIAGSLAPPLFGSGQILIEDQDISSFVIEKRRVGILYQEDFLFPHMTVGENLLFSLNNSGSRKLRILEVESALTNVGLRDFFQRLPSSLSGGQRARASLLRTFLSKPKLILLDEPFSKLDKVLRVSFREFVYEQLIQLRIPSVLVTHDSEDIPSGAKVISLERVTEAEEDLALENTAPSIVKTRRD